MNYDDISRFIFSLIAGSLIWFIKQTFKELKDLQATKGEHESKIIQNFFSIKNVDKDVQNNKEMLKEHEKRLDKHDREINTIVTTHNNTNCAKNNKTDLTNL